VLWTMWAVDMSRPGAVDRLGQIKGTDFLQFYVGGSFAREGQLARFYDPRQLHARAEALVPASRDTVYMPIQSPQTAVAFAPLSALSYVPAVTIWFGLIAVIYIAACWLIWRRCGALHAYPVEVCAAAAAFPGLYSTMLHGQTSVIALLAVAAALEALRRDRPLAAGVAFGCVAFKPHWVAVAVGIFALAREWRVVIGAAVSAGAQIALAWAAAGTAAMTGYVRILASIQQLGDLLEPRPGDSLRGYFKAFVPIEPAAFALYLAASVVAAVVAARMWRSRAAFELRASAVVLAMVLISPHAFAYDLILLAPVFLLVANLFAEGDLSLSPTDSMALRLRTPDWWMAWSLCALFSAPILAAVPAPLRLQVSVGAMAMLLAAAHRASRRYRRTQENRPPGRAPQSRAAAAPTPDAATTAPAPVPAYTGGPQPAARARLRPATR
jgi:glycosyl transferase family 87